MINQVHLQEKFDIDQGFDEYLAFRGKNADELNAILGEWLDSRSARGARPLFLYVHYLDPHWSYHERTRGLREHLGSPAMSSEPPIDGNEVDTRLDDGIDDADLRALHVRYLHGVAATDRATGLEVSTPLAGPARRGYDARFAETARASRAARADLTTAPRRKGSTPAEKARPTPIDIDSHTQPDTSTTTWARVIPPRALGNAAA